MNVNKVIIAGYLTRDIELRYTPSNTAVGNIGLAVNRRYRTNDGQNHEETTFVDCEAWGKTAETMSNYLSKGKPVFIEGRLKLDQWQDKDGNNRSKLKVVVESFQFVDSGGGGGGSREGGKGASARGKGSSRGAPDPYEAIDEDDIPF